MGNARCAKILVQIGRGGVGNAQQNATQQPCLGVGHEAANGRLPPRFGIVNQVVDGRTDPLGRNLDIRPCHQAIHLLPRQIVAVAKFGVAGGCVELATQNHLCAIFNDGVAGRLHQNVAADGLAPPRYLHTFDGDAQIDLGVAYIWLASHHACQGQGLATIVVEGDVGFVEGGLGG